MPVSSTFGKEQVLQWIKEKNITLTKILDLGAGVGTYATLLKSNGLGVNAEWIAIEVWEPYISKYSLHSLYNAVINSDVREVDFSKFTDISVTFAGDILEHMTKEDAIDIVNKVLQVSDSLIISVPIVYSPQGVHEGNPYEKHIKPDWTHSEVLTTWNGYIKESWAGAGSDVGVYWLSKK